MIKGYQVPSGTIIVLEEQLKSQTVARVAIYAQVSSAEHRENLERQAERLTQYCTTRGYQVAQVVKEIDSGVNDGRPKLLSLLGDPSITMRVVEHKDRLTRFGFRYIETLLESHGRRIHADVNGSYNILRKAFPNSFGQGIAAPAVVPRRLAV